MGMGNNANQSSGGLVGLHDFFYSGVDLGDVTLHIFFPELPFYLQFRIRQAIILTAHGDKAGLKVLYKILLKAADHSRTVFIQKKLKARMMYGGGGINRSVVMVKYKTFIFHNFLRKKFYTSIAQPILKAQAADFHLRPELWVIFRKDSH
jgi:hypothetical protein